MRTENKEIGDGESRVKTECKESELSLQRD